MVLFRVSSSRGGAAIFTLTLLQIVGLAVFLVVGAVWVRSAGDDPAIPQAASGPPWSRARTAWTIAGLLALLVAGFVWQRPDDAQWVKGRIRHYLALGRSPAGTAREFLERLEKTDMPVDLLAPDAGPRTHAASTIFAHRFERAYPCSAREKTFVMYTGKLEALNRGGSRVWFSFAMVVEDRRDGLVCAFRTGSRTTDPGDVVAALTASSGSWRQPTSKQPDLDPSFFEDSDERMVREMIENIGALYMADWKPEPLPAELVQK